MMKPIQAGLVAVVMSLEFVLAWADPMEDFYEGIKVHEAKNYAEAVK